MIVINICYDSETVNLIIDFLILEPSIFLGLKACFSLCGTIALHKISSKTLLIFQFLKDVMVLRIALLNGLTVQSVQ